MQVGGDARRSAATIRPPVALVGALGQRRAAARRRRARRQRERDLRRASGRGRRASAACPSRDDPAVGDDRDPVGEALGLLHVVRRQEHGLAELAQARRSPPRRRGAPTGRSRSSARRGRSAPGRRSAPARRRGAGAGRRTARSPARSACSVRPTSASVSSTGARRAVVAGVELEALAHGQARLGLRLLEHDPDPLAPAAPARAHGSAPSTSTLAGGRRGGSPRGSRRSSSCRRRSGRGRRRSRRGGPSRSIPRTASWSP